MGQFADGFNGRNKKVGEEFYQTLSASASYMFK
jgi:hypothetical protein